MKLFVTYIENGCKKIAGIFKNNTLGMKRAQNKRDSFSSQGFVTSIERKNNA